MHPYLQATLEEAQKSIVESGVPIGPVLVLDGKIGGRGHNCQKQRISMARTTSKPPPEEGRYQLRGILLGQGFELK
jgi:hypothetical protein